MVSTSGFLALLSALALASPVYAAPSPFGGWHELEKRNVIWQNCSIFDVDSPDPNLKCALYDVPLDYHDSTVGQATLAIAKYCGNAEKKLGALFTNPGGPGASGVDFVIQTGVELAAMFEGAYDIVSWDPRGVGAFTSPGDVTCFDNAEDDAAYFQNSIVQSINYTVAGNFNKKEQEELFSKTQEDSDLLIGFGKRCQKGPVGKFLQYLGTTSTVRDLVTLADCIVGPGTPINFWGFSYGTIIGSTLLTMFPERAGRIILDGVVDPKTWVTFKIPSTSLTDAEKTFSAFGDACASAGKQGCKLIEFICEGDELPTGPQITKLLTDVHDTSLELQRAGVSQLPLAPGELLGTLHEALTIPASWSSFANTQAFDLALTVFSVAQALNVPFGNYKIPKGQLRVRAAPAESAQTAPSHAFQAVIGADNSADVSNGVGMGAVLNQVVTTTQTVSPTFGGVWSLGNNFGWPTRSVEPVPSPNFAGVGSNVLVVGNSADPITPFAGAQSTANQIGPFATLVQQQGVGHTSMAQTSSCTSNIVSNYLLTSTLPSSSTGPIQCPVDPSSNNLFPGVGTGSPSKRKLSTYFRRRILAPYSRGVMY